MSEPATRPTLPSTPHPEMELESPAAEQLRREFPWLRFRKPLEREFRYDHLDQTRRQVRFNFWLALACILIFFAVSYWVLDRTLNADLNLIRLCVVVPGVLVGLAVLYSDVYHRTFSPLIQVMAPLFGISVVVEFFLAARHGVSVFPAVVLAIICIHLLVGMLFYAALRSSLVVSVAYFVGAVYFELPPDQSTYNFAVLLVTNAIGATACYALEKAQRTHFLEAKLLTEMASRDGLTGIHNRRMFDEHLEKTWQQAGREHVSVALLLVDIDCFKAYNDHYGHQAGDTCLKRVARALTHSARRPLDFAARYGGEEFAIVLYNTRRDYVEDLTRRVHASIAELALQHPASNVAQQLTVSIGAACVVPNPNRSRFGFIQLADEALYEAKGTGRNRAVVMDKEYETMTTGSFRTRAAAI